MKKKMNFTRKVLAVVLTLTLTLTIIGVDKCDGDLMDKKDLDRDGVNNDEDNCPDSYNPG